MKKTLLAVVFLFSGSVVTTGSSLFPQLSLAFRLNLVDEVRKLLFQGAQVNTRLSEGKTLLSLASENADVAMVKALLVADDIDVNCVSERRTPLFVVSEMGYINVVKELLKARNIDLYHTPDSGWTAIHVACFCGHHEIVREFLKVNPSLVNLTTESGDTPLHLAASMNKMNVIKVLLEAGADSSLVNSQGKTAEEEAGLWSTKVFLEEQRTGIKRKVISAETLLFDELISLLA